jgi:tetratricopeptide (TPR) repeat protein
MARTQSGAEATKLFRELLNSSPETPGIWQSLGEYAFSQGRLAEARSCFLNSLEHSPWSVRSHFGLACLDAAEHDLARALDRLHQIPAINPAWISLRGRSLFPPALRDSLKAAITSSVDAAPPYPPRSCSAGPNPLRCWVESGLVETAWPEAVKQLSMRQTGSAELYYWRAIGFEQLGSIALDHLLETPGSARGLTLAAQIFVWLKQDRQATEILHRALQLEPANGEAWTSLGKIQRHNVELEDAENSLLKGIELGHSDAEAYFMLGEIYARRHEPQQALIFLERSLKLHRPTDALRTILAKVYGELGEDSKQIAHLLMIPPERRKPPVLYQLYQAYERTGQTARAQQALADYRRSKDQESRTR